ncbi:peptidase S8/S53 subtilisin kexin sedolisin [Halorubrum kocurii JCM 14978]|uniref:Peptidase S8/S53 subtilisin kexin sedolisin n=1 Tax=Halorubrum kocurii JCM 14978 TaxID=1230456 RepID=M0NHH2_9EURY|nr:peptidase S8/S53 subtilisin kexin sedolisin [Halorubrum kocurii JCM 14978]
MNSAGNQRQNHYEAQFSDTTNNSFHNFPETGDGNWLNSGDQITAGTPLQISLTWDRWPTTAADYDLGVYRANSSGSDDLVASSTRRQTGAEEPVEIISSTAPTDGRYYVAVRNADAPGSETLELFVVSGGPFGVQTPESSLTAPAAGRNITTVAASNWDQTETTYYSSMGPTNDGRIGVDVTGPTAVTNSVYGTYAGTSASAPHVGGVAALLTSKHPVLRGSELRTLIRHSGGASSPTLAAGYGPTNAVRAADRADKITAIGMTPSPARSKLNQTETTNVTVTVNNTRGIANYTLSVTTENASRIPIENVTTVSTPANTNTTISTNQSSATTTVTNASIGANDTVKLGTITVRGNQSGSSNLTVTVSNISTTAGYQYQPKSLTNKQTISISDQLPDITGNGLSPTDPDGDGTFEDINGDGRASISDVQALFSARSHDAVRKNPSAFDFNGDGAVSISDVQRLFVLLQR